MTICIIPARGGSKRLPRKNVLPFKGAPIIARPIEAAIIAGLPVYVTSDSTEILQVAQEYGASPFMRNPEYATDDASEIHAYREVITSLPERPDFFVALYATAAFITADDILQGLELCRDFDVVMGVSEYEGPHPYQMMVQEGDFWRLKVPGLNEMSPYPKAVASNGSMYVFRTSEFMKNPSYYPPKLGIMYTKSVDINTESDFKKAEDMA